MLENLNFKTINLYDNPEGAVELTPDTLKKYVVELYYGNKKFIDNECDFEHYNLKIEDLNITIINQILGFFDIETEIIKK